MAIETIVWFVLYLLIAGGVFGLLWFLIDYLEKQGLGPPIMFKVIRIVFVVLTVLFCIGILLSLLGVPLIQLPRRNGP